MTDLERDAVEAVTRCVASGYPARVSPNSDEDQDGLVELARALAHTWCGLRVLDPNSFGSYWDLLPDDVYEAATNLWVLLVWNHEAW